MSGFADFRKGSCGSSPIFGKVYEDFWSDAPLGHDYGPHFYVRE